MSTRAWHRLKVLEAAMAASLILPTAFAQNRAAAPNGPIDFSQIKNFAELVEHLGLTPWYSNSKPVKHKIKVAILDNSFTGHEKLLGKTLPKDTQYFDGPLPGTPPAGAAPVDSHGLKMAETLVATATNNGKQPTFAPELYLIKASGYSNFKAAIDKAILFKVDIILHSLVREYGNNFDGAGIFNKEVDRAISKGIVWINAAGNFGQTTYNLARIEGDSEGWLKLPGPNRSLPIKCGPAKNQNVCQVRLVLAWNSFTADPETGTDKDLDLTVLDESLGVVGGSSLVQTRAEKAVQGQSKLAREIVTLELKPGRYFLKVQDKSRNFGAKDRLRIVGEGAGLTFEYKDTEETLLNPADNPRVLTVGAGDDLKSSSSRRLGKPEILGPSKLDFGNNIQFLGSSNAAALTAGAFVVVMNWLGPMDWQAFLKLFPGGAPAPTAVADSTSHSKQTRKTRDSSSALVRGFDFGPPNGSNCFPPRYYSNLPQYIAWVLARGGSFVETSQGLKIFVPFDPAQLAPGMQRFRPDDAVVITPAGFRLFMRGQVPTMSNNFAEVFQIPADYGICSQ
jgi:hypothetical protein